MKKIIDFIEKIIFKINRFQMTIPDFIDKYIVPIQIWSLHNRTEIVYFTAGFILGALIF